jgi:hypothetical protein
MENKTCENCIWFKIFEKRPDEPSNMGCTQKNWAGYLTDTAFLPCGGIHHATLKMDPFMEQGLNKNE